MRGVILAGGTGSRLKPLTDVINKHLLPVFNKPMIYYPLTTLMLAGISQIAIVCNREDLGLFRKLLGDGRHLNLEIQYFIQDQPNGIVGGILACKAFIEDRYFCLILGDNLIYGPGLGRNLISKVRDTGATILAHSVSNPEKFGVIEFNVEGNPISIQEKPEKFISNWAIPGIYFYDNTALARISDVRPSKRGELEISDLNRSYLESKDLSIIKMPLGTAWLDLGSSASLLQAGLFIQILEERQGIRIGDPNIAALQMQASNESH
jgi:glucose-1-phosphate thymidylyltransferase